MPRTKHRLPCPHCGSLDNRPLGITGLIGTESMAVLLRKYRCRNCGKPWQSIEMADIPMPEPSFPEWVGLEADE